MNGRRVGAVLLAAGSGSRLGHRPKSLLMLDGVPLLLRQINALQGAGVAAVVVVLGHHADRIAPVLQGLPVTVVHNPRPDDGQVSSQRLGLAALAEAADKLDAVIVALADQPLIDAADITALIGTWQQRPAGKAVTVPMVDGQRGNPVIFSAAVCAAVLQGDAQFGCRQWQAAHPDAVASFATDNTHYKTDIDTPDDLARFERDTGHTLRWPTTAGA